MIDLHCHILPGIDDGPRTVDEAVEMCRIAAADGISTIVATPHHRPGRYELNADTVLSRIIELQDIIESEGMNLKILPGADVTISPELLVSLRKKPHLTVNMTGRYFLAEFPHEVLPKRWDVYLQSFLIAGYVPIVTHPERNTWFLRNRDALVPFVRNGGMVQVTAMSLTGSSGRRSYDYCMHLLEHNMVHVIASDAHSPEYRMPVLSEAVKRATAVVGENRARSMVTHIPETIVAGGIPPMEDPIETVKERSWLRRFLTRI